MQALVFDFDGVIVDSERVHGRALRAVCAPFGPEFQDFPDDRFVGWPDAEALRAIFAGGGLTLGKPVLAELLASKHRYILERLRNRELAPYPGVLDLIRAAADAVPIGVCSAAMGAEIRAALQALEVLDRFSAIVGVEDAPLSKPDPAPYALAAARLGADPGRCVAIEDSVNGVASAKEAGYRVAAVGHTTHRSLLARADLFVERIASLNVPRLEALSA